MRVLFRTVEVRLALAVIALAGAYGLSGCGGASSPGSAVTATPTFSPGGGTYNTSQTVTISDTTSGAVLYCTTDGTTPTASSPKCAQPTTVYQTEYLQAIAVAPGKTASDVASAGYVIDLNAAPTPAFSPAGGTYTSTQNVTISDSLSGANIYYTTDGTTPTASSALYTGAITVSSTKTLSAIAVASGYNNSGVASALYTITPTTATPTFSLASGTYTGTQTVTISDATSGAKIYYTIDGSAPTTSSTVYSGTITISSTETINAIAIASGYAQSATASAVYTIALPAAATPTFSLAAGTYTTTQTVTISDTTSGATIYYTIDGSTPTSASTEYSGPISVTSTETIKAIASASGYTNSSMASATYTIDLATAATPTFSPAAGTYTTAQTVTISDATSGATIYYTIDGSTPTTSSSVYSSSITVSSSETIKAIAVASGYNNSAVATAAYTISIGTSSLTGTVLSGTTPVVAASVQLYAAGQTGYGSTPTALLASAVTTDSNGKFSFTYNCPASPGDLVYLVATGGGTATAGANADLEMMTALGSCNSFSSNPNLASSSPSLVINEATTVAAAYALSPFMTTAPNVGSSSTNYQGLSNAFNTAAYNLINPSTGVVPAYTPAYTQTLSADTNIVNNSTVPQARINTLANILNTCVNSNNSGCGNLFTEATPSGGTAPTNTLQAILDIAQNPGNNVSSLYTLTSSSEPFSPVLSDAPNDWTLALTFTGGGLGLSPSFSSTTRMSNTGLAADSKGNLWVTGYAGSSSLSLAATKDMVVEFSPLGAPQTTATTVSGTTPAYGGWWDTSLTVKNVYSIAIDPSTDYLWLGNGQQNSYPISEVSSDLSVVQKDLEPWNYSTDYSLAVDAGGNVWIGGYNSYSLDEFSSTGVENSWITEHSEGFPGTPSIAYPVFAGFNSLTQLVFDSNGNLWAEDTSVSTGYGAGVDLINQADGTLLYAPFMTSSASAYSTGYSSPLAADGSGNVYSCGSASDGQTLSTISGNSSSITGTYAISTGRGCGALMVFDGLGHLFTITGNNTYLKDTTTNQLTSALVSAQVVGVIDEYSTTNGTITQLSPSTGYTGTSSAEALAINPDPWSAAQLSTAKWDYSGNYAGHSFAKKQGLADAAIDGSGNLWVLNADTGASCASVGLSTCTASFPGNVLVEFVGIAAPVLTPTSRALSYGELGTRP